MVTIYTIGHGRHAWADFLALLRQYEIEVLCDVRSAARSRWPATNEWTLKLTQKYTPSPPDFSRTLITSIYLSEEEYEVLSVFEGNELRKNRYPYEHEGRVYAVDLFLGDLRGLVLAETDFDDDEELDAFNAPSFAHLDVTRDELFTGARLVELTAEEIRRRVMSDK